jgi:hypothetical protein
VCWHDDDRLVLEFVAGSPAAHDAAVVELPRDAMKVADQTFGIAQRHANWFVQNVVGVDNADLADGEDLIVEGVTDFLARAGTGRDKASAESGEVVDIMALSRTQSAIVVARTIVPAQASRGSAIRLIVPVVL